MDRSGRGPRLRAWLRRRAWPRLLLSHLLVTLAGVAVVAIYAGSVLVQSRIVQVEHSLQDLGFALSNNLEEPLGAYVAGNGSQAAVLAVLQSGASLHSGTELLVVTPAGQVLAGSGLSPSSDDPRDDPEVQAALRGAGLTSLRRDATGREMLYTAVPVLHERDIYGPLRLASAMAPVREAIAGTVLALGALVVGVMFLAALLAWWLATSLTSPIEQLTAAAHRVAGGQWPSGSRAVPGDGPVSGDRAALSGRGVLRGGEELARLARAFDAMAHRVQATLDQQRAFVANASHELRTPLTSVKLRVEALRDGAWQEPEVGPRFLAEIDGEVDRLSQVADGLLDLARIEGGLDAAQRGPVDMPLLCAEVRDEFSVRARRAGVTVSVLTPGAVPAALGDEAQLRRLVTNLLDNAIKFTPAGGSVTLRVAAASLGGVPAVALEAADTGVGIAPDHLPHIFERFYRAEPAPDALCHAAPSTPGPRRAGSGLGLSLVRSLAAAYGGVATASSLPGQGTTIRVVVPAVSRGL